MLVAGCRWLLSRLAMGIGGRAGRVEFARLGIESLSVRLGEGA